MKREEEEEKKKSEREKVKAVLSVRAHALLPVKVYVRQAQSSLAAGRGCSLTLQGNYYPGRTILTQELLLPNSVNADSGCIRAKYGKRICRLAETKAFLGDQRRTSDSHIKLADTNHRPACHPCEPLWNSDPSDMDRPPT